MDVRRIVVINERVDQTIAETVQRLFKGYGGRVPVSVFREGLRRIGSSYYVIDEELIGKRGSTVLEAFNGNVYYAHCNRIFPSEDLIDF